MVLFVSFGFFFQNKKKFRVSNLLLYYVDAHLSSYNDMQSHSIDPTTTYYQFVYFLSEVPTQERLLVFRLIALKQT